MNFYLMIMNSNKKPMSGAKTNSPKMFNIMNELAKKYSGIFKEEYKVKRVIMTKNGWKTI